MGTAGREIAPCSKLPFLQNEMQWQFTGRKVCHWQEKRTLCRASTPQKISTLDAPRCVIQRCDGILGKSSG